jgi:hypothetical protein
MDQDVDLPPRSQCDRRIEFRLGQWEVSRHKFCPALESLRAVAAMLVVICTSSLAWWSSP